MKEFFIMFLTLKQKIFFLSAAIFLTGCASAKSPSSITPGANVLPAPISTPGAAPVGIYHKVKLGETVWRIARMYQVTIDEIIQSNKIPNAAQIEKDQLIFIPGGTEYKAAADSNQKEFIWPVEGRKILAYFGQPKNNYISKGIDIETKEGQIVRASREGKVVLADYLNGVGYTVILDHQDGFSTVYTHNATLLAKTGDKVAKGDSLAYAATTGKNSYVHFQIRKNAVVDNPLYYLP